MQTERIGPQAGELWHGMEAAGVAERLSASISSGLTSTEAGRRLTSAGPNVLPEAPGRTIRQTLIEQFSSFLILLLLTARKLAQDGSHRGFR